MNKVFSFTSGCVFHCGVSINALGNIGVEVEAENGTTGVGTRLLSLLFLKFIVLHNA